MSEKEFSKDENIPHVSEDHVEEAGSSSSGSGQRQPEEAQEARPHPVGSESRDSGHDSPLEGAVGGEMENDDGVVGETRHKRFSAGKADLFRRFFSDEYSQVQAPILDGHKHASQRQGPRHFSDSSRTQSSSGSSPLGLFQLKDSSSELVLNQAGDIEGKTAPTIEPEFEQCRNENGPALSGFGRMEDSEPSIGSVETALIGDVCTGNSIPSRPSSDSPGLSSGLSFPSVSSRPPTAASDNLKADNQLPKSESHEGSKLSPTAANSETLVREKPARQRRFGISQLAPVRSKSALAGTSADYAGQSSDTGDELQKRKISKDLSVCSEPLPQRKISKESFDSFERMSSEDEAINYPELSHSVESDSCLPMPDLEQEEEAENLQEILDALQVSAGTASETTLDINQNVGQETCENVHDLASETKPDVIDQNVEQES